MMLHSQVTLFILCHSMTKSCVLVSCPAQGTLTSTVLVNNWTHDSKGSMRLPFNKYVAVFVHSPSLDSAPHACRRWLHTWLLCSRRVCCVHTPRYAERRAYGVECWGMVKQYLHAQVPLRPGPPARRGRRRTPRWLPQVRLCHPYAAPMALP